MKTMLIGLVALLALTTVGCSHLATSDQSQVDHVVLEGALAQRVVAAEQEGTVYARLTLGTESPTEAPRPRANVVLVLDSSGSMKGAPIEAVRHAAAAMIDALSEHDRLAIVAFHSTTEVLLPSTPIDESTRANAKERVASMRASGTTDMAGGLRAGIDQALLSPGHDAIHRIILLGDGVPNDGSRLRAMAQEAAEDGITITSFGLGQEYDEALMGSIAQLSGGRFHYVEGADRVLAVFQAEALRLQSVYAKNAVLELTPGPGVSVQEVLGQQVSWRGNVAQIALGDMSRDEKREIFVKLHTSGHKDGAAIELADAVVLFDDEHEPGKRLERRVYLEATASKLDSAIEEGRDREVEKAVARAEAAAQTLREIERARQGDKAAAAQNLERASGEARKRAAQLADPKLAAQVEQMEALGQVYETESRHDAAPAVAAPKASPAKPKPAAHTLREVHDSAMQLLQ